MPRSQSEVLFQEILHLKEPLVGSLAFFYFVTLLISVYVVAKKLNCRYLSFININQLKSERETQNSLKNKLFSLCRQKESPFLLYCWFLPSINFNRLKTEELLEQVVFPRLLNNSPWFENAWLPIKLCIVIPPPLEANRKLKDIWSIEAHLAIEDKYSEMFKYTLSGMVGRGLMLDLSEKMKKNLYILFFASEVVCSFPPWSE